MLQNPWFQVRDTRCSGTPPTRRTDRDRRHPEMQMEDVEVGSVDRRIDVGVGGCRWDVLQGTDRINDPKIVVG